MSSPQSQQIIKLSDNDFYFIKHLDHSILNIEQYTLFNIPLPIFLIALIVGLVCSLLLAWHFASPAKILSRAFENLSKGDFSVRIGHKFKYRHDEFAILAKEFDSMVEHIALLHFSRESLLHDLSHELRTPLARLQLAIGLAEQNPNNIDKSLARIELESKKIDHLIDDILTYFRCDFNVNQDECFDLNKLLLFVIRRKQDKINSESKSIKIVYSAVKSSSYKVFGSADKFQIALENIIRNAIRFTPNDGVIKVELEKELNHFIIRVIDQGKGVDESKLSSMFEPFLPIQSGTIGKGYGLGLAITKKIVIAHKGKISAQNGPDKGLIVTIIVPTCGL